MIPISTKDRLPENNQYVLARFPNMPWEDPDTDIDHLWVVVRFVRGLSVDDRAALSDEDERKHLYSSADEYANNQCPYCWDTFGSDSFFGQEADYWCELPKI